MQKQQLRQKSSFYNYDKYHVYKFGSFELPSKRKIRSCVFFRAHVISCLLWTFVSQSLSILICVVQFNTVTTIHFVSYVCMSVFFLWLNFICCCISSKLRRHSAQCVCVFICARRLFLSMNITHELACSYRMCFVFIYVCMTCERERVRERATAPSLKPLCTLFVCTLLSRSV